MFRILLWLFTALFLAVNGTISVAQIPLTLPETVNLALKINDPSVAVFDERAAALEDQAIAESQLPDPVLNASIVNFPLSSFDYNREPMTQLKFGISQKLPKGNTLALTRAKRQTQAKDQRLQKELRERQIVMGARQTWLTLYYWREARKLTEESQRKVGQLGGVAEAVYATGRSSLQDVLRVDLETTALGAKLIDIDRNQDIARADMERLIGRSDGQRPITSAFPVLPTVNGEADIRINLPRHPSLQVLDARIETKSRDVDLAKEQYKPGFAFNASYGLRDSRSDFGSVGVSVQLPLFSKKNKDYALSASKRMRAAQRLERDVQALELERSLRREWAQYTRLGERITAYESDVLIRATETSEAAMSAYENELADFSELIRAELAVLDIKLILLRLRIERAVAKTNLLYLSGA
ncbi:MAG: TolC family protein [Robiginitomaculum sp.]|nr:TolC family protein [Robiginitomaculum sp.]